ncbi:hypothetical protein Mgra_00008915 [Meloidogyne graminicola]|uniref:Uncharacterized protein n=1 Tax=Meloidogyne graminicola TaxID=189291 RepID=A0A8S9ZEJ3_9BILA|nr:hypothetical protein Mgra_00008915 [Meloidogyne graminicola]
MTNILFRNSIETVFWLNNIRKACSMARKQTPRFTSYKMTNMPAESIKKGRTLPDKLIKRKQAKHSLVIFDKDGTLICFHSILCEASKLEIAKDVYSLLGYCPIQERVRTGLLAHGTMQQIREGIKELLIDYGMEEQEAIEMVSDSVTDCNTSCPKTLKQIHDLRALFSKLKELGLKIAICTADSRAGTENSLRSLSLESFVDFVMCGDDIGSKPKPNPHNALHICRELGIDPKEALMVGDTAADMGMGRGANVGTTVGVLSGIGDFSELSPNADHILPNVGCLLPVVLGEQHNESM